jgi:sigma-E factor negative regulatory protein RseC
MEFPHHLKGARPVCALPALSTQAQFSESPHRDDLAGAARVVAADAGQVWLEPEQTSSCGGCASAAACGGKGIGTLANRLEARRFVLADPIGLRAGDRVLVSFGDRALVKAASVTYVIPLVFSLALAAIAQALMERDSLTLVAALLGLGIGFGSMRLLGARMAARGTLTPRIVRRLDPNLNL